MPRIVSRRVVGVCMNVSASNGFAPGDFVRLLGNPQRIGHIERLQELGGALYARIRFPDGTRQIPIGQIEPLPPAPQDPLDFLAAGALEGPSRLRQTLAHVRLTGRLADMLYSLSATNTDFHPHQFKPVLKMLGSPTGALLVADEVGLGKTIEAGLVWTELRARQDLRRMLVLCPAVLQDKWIQELKEKFLLDARKYKAAELFDLLSDRSAHARGFVAVASLQGLRPSKRWEEEDREGGRAADRLARFLDAHATDAPLLDLVVIDEAHHLRNPDTRANFLGAMVREVSSHQLFLTATPIHLRNRDLLSLLRLIDPETFRDEATLAQIIDANAALVSAREACLRGRPIEELIAALDTADQDPLLAGSAQISAIRDSVEGAENWNEAARARTAGRIEDANLLANVVTRTRRRDVQGLKVIRVPFIAKATFSELERQVYDRISAEVRAYANRADMPPAFLLAGPQRLLASSIPAALAHWRANLVDAGYEDEEEDWSETTTPVLKDGVEKLVAKLSVLAASLPSPERLEIEDSKFAALLAALRAHFVERPAEKVILFSSFRATLSYLRRRLDAAGIPCATLHGGVQGRTELIAGFKDSSIERVLLSSEVGSEGVDLQFARVVVNYDLPWNPMRLEQRIGRVDRLGQDADTVSVVNLLHRNTIDEAIHDRLFERLGVCERALGGFEELLGAEIAALTPELLLGDLTAAQIEERLVATAQALETRRMEEERLEQEAAALVAHGDRILQHVMKARSQQLWLGADELAAYLSGGLEAAYPGSRLRRRLEGGVYELTLSPAAKDAYRAWLDRRRSTEGRHLLIASDPLRCRIGAATTKADRAARVEGVPQTHPFVRFVAESVEAASPDGLRPAAAARLSREALPENVSIEQGRYVVLAEHWSFDGITPVERIAYAGLRLPDGAPIDGEFAETLMLAAGASGEPWSGAAERIDLAAVAELCLDRLPHDLSLRFQEAVRSRQAELKDRAAIQRRTVERRLADRRASLREVIARQRYRFNAGGSDAEKARKAATLNEAKLRAEEERAAARLREIEDNARLRAESLQLAAVLVEVT